MMSRRPATALKGRPPPMAFPSVHRSGVSPKCSWAPPRGDPEAGDDLVEDQEGAVAGADLLHAAQVIFPRQQATAVAQDRLHDHRGDVAAMLPEEVFNQVRSIPGADQQIVQRGQELTPGAGCGPGDARRSRFRPARGGSWPGSSPIQPW